MDTVTLTQDKLDQIKQRAMQEVANRLQMEFLDRTLFVGDTIEVTYQVTFNNDPLAPIQLKKDKPNPFYNKEFYRDSIRMAEHKDQR